MFVLLINIPFGYWRGGVKKFSFKWFLAVHLPVPFVYAMRIYAGISWELVTFPLLIGSYFAGQFIGSWLRSLKKISPPSPEPEG